MSKPDIIVTLPPPTPNGGLHVGHMAGPFLAADIFVKSMQKQGQTVHVLSYSDTNQSYVRATAEKQGCDPKTLASEWTRDILQTLALYNCQVDQYFEPDVESNEFVRNIILKMFERGVLKKKPHPFFYSLDREIFLDEAAVSGLCPRCLDNSKCGICEACGFLTNANNIIAPYATNSPEELIEIHEVKVLLLDPERWRNKLRKFHSFQDPIRPKYRWLVDDAFREELPIFPVTVPGSWGIKIDHHDLPDQVINPWAELVFDFVYGYQRIDDENTTPKIVNFFGYDNSYFYSIVHVTLLYAANLDRYLPSATMINEFYNLENAKFSTSRGHLIWARELAEEIPSDLVRFYCAMTAPGFEQGNFNRNEMDDVLENRLISQFRQISVSIPNRIDSSLFPKTSLGQTIASVVESRVSRSFALERFQLRHAAEDSLKGLEAIRKSIEQGMMSRDDALIALLGWANAIAPIMPQTAVELIDALNSDYVPPCLPCLSS